ncbi:Uncharacterised protein [Bordetella pertussis]|nr:Uncharacterised protein [Bordetella pertussis]
MQENPFVTGFFASSRYLDAERLNFRLLFPYQT